MKRILVFLLAFGFIAIGYSQPSQINDKLRKYKLFEYYTKTEADSLSLNPKEISFSPISLDDIKPNFSNFDDLDWLKKAAQVNKVLLVGETHYSSVTRNIRNRMLFAINTVDYYPLILLEEPYSYTPWVNYFINIQDDLKAENYFRTFINDIAGTKEDSVFFQHIRSWNKTHTRKRIEVGYYDLEFNQEVTFNKVLKPYFSKLKISASKLDSIFNLGLSDDFFSKIDSLASIANKVNLRGDIDFVDIKYIKNVISNLKNTSYAFRFDLNYYREKRIIYNITDRKVFGKKFNRGKSLVFGGGNHACTHFKYPNGDNFFKLGSFLNYDNLQTKGKTHSVMVVNLGFKLGAMANISLDNLFYGSQYGDIVKRLKKAFDEKLIDSETPYFVFNDKNEFIKLVVNRAYQHDLKALLLVSCNWDNLINKSAPELSKAIKQIRDETRLYDSYIFVPFSPIEVLRKNN